MRRLPALLALGLMVVASVQADAPAEAVVAEERTLELRYLGGSDYDQGEAVAVAGDGGLYIVGSTRSTDFPTTPNATQRQLAGGLDAFVLKLDAHGDLAWATFLGGAADDRALAVARASDGGIVVVGDTRSADFPVRMPLQSWLQGPVDGFVARFAAGGDLRWATYFGGSGEDTLAGVAVGGDKAVLAGSTSSSDLPVRGAFQPALAGGTDAFLAKLDAQGANVLYASYLGGGSQDSANALALDLQGRALLAGETASSDFPLRGAFRTAGDGFVARVNATGGRLLNASRLEGPANGVALDPAGRVLLGGWSPPPPPMGNPVAWLSALDAGLGGVLWRQQTGRGDTSNGGHATEAVAVRPGGGALGLGHNRAHGENLDHAWVEVDDGAGSLLGRRGIGFLAMRFESRGVAADAAGQSFAVGGADHPDGDSDVYLAVGSDCGRVPCTSLLLEGEQHGGWWTTAVGVDLTVECLCSAVTYASVDGGPFTPTTSLTLDKDGVHTVRYYSASTAGPVEWGRLATIGIDTTPPTARLDRPLSGHVYVSDAEAGGAEAPGAPAVVVGRLTLRGSAADATSGVARVHFLVDGQPLATATRPPYTASWTPSRGAHTVAFHAEDAAGHGSATEVAVLALG